MKKTTLFLIALWVHLSLSAQSAQPASASSANSSVADLSRWSSFHNPATLAIKSNAEILLSVDNRFIIKELSTKSLSFVYPTSWAVTALSVSHFGFEQYHEILAGVSFSRNFSDRFSLGLQFDYWSTYSYGSNCYYGALFPQVGLLLRLTDQLDLGFHSFNPFQTEIHMEATTKRVPSIFSMGLAYHMSSQLHWRLQADREIAMNYRLATAFEYQKDERYSFQVGVYGWEYMIGCLGVGIQLGSFGIEVGLELHPLLGLNSRLGIGYRFPEH